MNIYWRTLKPLQFYLQNYPAPGAQIKAWLRRAIPVLLFFAITVMLLVIAKAERNSLSAHHQFTSKVSISVMRAPQATAARFTIAGSRLSDRLYTEIWHTESYRLLFATTQSVIDRDPIKSDISAVITQLEALTEQSPMNALFFNDLSAAYYTLAQRQQSDSLRYSIRALQVVDRALELEPALIEAHFNRALILEQALLLLEAQTAWQAYLLKELSPQWLAIADTHLDRLDRRYRLDDWPAQRESLLLAISRGDDQTVRAIAHKAPYQVSEYANNELVKGWAEACLQHRAEDAARMLEDLRRIGQAINSLKHDRVIIDQVDAIDRAASASPERAQLFKMAQLYRRYFDLSESANLVEPLLTEIDKIQTSFARLGNHAAVVKVGLLRSRWDTNFAYSFRLLEVMRSIALSKGYQSLLGPIWRAIGSLKGQLLEPAEALAAQRNALRYLSETGDLAGAARVHLISAEILHQISETDQIWQHQYQALSYFSRLRDAARPALYYAAIATQLQKLGAPRAALYYHNESVQLGQQQRDPIAITMALRRRSFTENSLGAYRAALLDLDDARANLTLIQNRFLHNRLSLDLTILEGEYKLSHDKTGALNLFNEVINKNRLKGEHYFTTRLYKARADAYLALGDKVHAEKDLRTVIDEFEYERGQISDQEQRISFFQELQSSYENIIKLRLAEGSMVDAFNYVEKARARALLDFYPGSKKTNNLSYREREFGLIAHPLTLSEIMRKLSAKETLVEYAVQEDRLSVWVVSSAGMQFTTINCGATCINDLSEQLSAAINRHASEQELKELAIPLYDVVVRPIAQWLPKQTKIIFVPDKALATLPFAMLFNSHTERYLIEDYTISLTPSATIFLHCREWDRRLADHDDGRVLLVGNPAFNRKQYPNLEPLPSSEVEVTEIAASYPVFELLIGETATKKAFCQAAADYSTIHFAGHAIEDSDSPLYSRMILAADDRDESQDQGTLYSYEISKLSLKRTRLVVLAGCRTADGKYAAGEGVLSLARAFLSAGATAVAASLWNVRDTVTARLSIRFHQSRRAGKDASSALREAQLSMLQSDNPNWRSPAIWGTFILIGDSSF